MGRGQGHFCIDCQYFKRYIFVGNKMEGDDLLCEFQNQEQEKKLLLQKQIFVEQKPSLRYQQNANPNAATSVISKIFQNYQQFYKSIYNIKAHLERYKQSIDSIIYAKKIHKQFADQITVKQRSEKLQYNYEEVVEELRDLYRQNKNVIRESQKIEEFLEIDPKPVLKIFKITLMKTLQEQRIIDLCMNKLKVMVLKAVYKESTNLEYLIECYTAHLKSALNEHSIKYREEQKSQKYRMIQLYFSRSSFIFNALISLASRFDVIGPLQLNHCKIAPHKYFTALRKGLINNQQPIYFINFYTEPLLFIDHEYIHFDSNLLFCPVVSRGATITLSSFYLMKLAQTCPDWSRQQLCLEIFHLATSTKIPIFYSCFKQHKSTKLNYFNYQRCIDAMGASKVFKQKKQFQRFNSIISSLVKIRRFVFSRIIFNWLSKIMATDGKKDVEIDIMGKFRVVASIKLDPITYPKTQKTPEEQPQIMTSLLLAAAKKQNPSYSRQHLQDIIYATMQAVLLKLVAQKTGYKVSWPMEPGSMGMHYFDYTKQKNIVRKEVKQFINQF